MVANLESGKILKTVESWKLGFPSFLETGRGSLQVLERPGSSKANNETTIFFLSLLGRAGQISFISWTVSFRRLGC